jgi:hypothetical protein
MCVGNGTETIAALPINQAGALVSLSHQRPYIGW